MINFDFLHNDIGDIIVNNSGGPDCAIVFYAVAKYIKENNLPCKIYHTTIDSREKFFYIHHAKQIINFVEQELNVPCEHHYTKDNVNVGKSKAGLPTNYASTQRELITEVKKRHSNAKYLITGSSNMLPPKLLKSAQKKGNWLEAEISPDRKRYKNTKKDTFVKFVEGHYKFEPFANSDKRYIRECYDYYNVTDTLFPLTRSCESPNSSTHYKGQEHCGKCLFCFERYTAFGKL